jgi:hypothetical protein
MESVKINGVEKTEKQGKNGMYTIYKVMYNGNKQASTIKKELGDYLASHIDQMVNADVKPNNNGYMEFMAIEGVQVVQKGGGGGFTRKPLSPEERARIDKAMVDKRNGINAAVALQEARAAMPDVLNLPGVLEDISKTSDPVKEYLSLTQKIATAFRGMLDVLGGEGK